MWGAQGTLRNFGFLEYKICEMQWWEGNLEGEMWTRLRNAVCQGNKIHSQAPFSLCPSM